MPTTMTCAREKRRAHPARRVSDSSDPARGAGPVRPASQAWPQLARDAFRHDRHRGARAPLGRREAAPAHEVDAEHAEVFRRDELVRDGRPCRSRAVGEGGARPAERARPRGRHRGDRRLAPSRPRPSAAAPLLVDDLDDDGVGGADAGIDGRRRQRAAQEHGRADEEQRGCGHLESRSARSGRGRVGRLASPRRESSAPAPGAWPAAPARARRTPSRRSRQQPGTARRASPRRARRDECPRMSGGMVLITA